MAAGCPPARALVAAGASSGAPLTGRPSGGLGTAARASPSPSACSRTPARCRRARPPPQGIDMGGFGSGRPVERATIGRTWSFVLTTKNFRDTLRRPVWAEFRLNFDVNGDRLVLRASLDTLSASPSLELRHPARRE